MAKYYQTDLSFEEIKETLKGTLNPGFIKKQNRTEKDIDIIAEHHAHLHLLFAEIEALDPKTTNLSGYADLVEQMEFALQEAWGFDINRDYHSWWYKVPHCKCPRMDNEDNYGTQYRIIRGDCPVHGAEDVTID